MFADDKPGTIVPQVIQQTRAAEYQRIKRLHTLKSPVQLAQWALQNGVDAHDKQTGLQYARVNAATDMAKRDDEAAVLQKQLYVENQEISRMIEGLGYKPQTDSERALIWSPEEYANLSTPDTYSALLQDNGRNSDTTEKMMVNTYDLLTQEREGLKLAFADAQKGKQEDQVRSLRRRMTRNGLLLYRVTDVFQYHCKVQNKNTSLPILREDIKRKREAMAKPKNPAVISPGSSQSQPPSTEISPKPKRYIELKLRDDLQLQNKGQLIETHDLAWRPVNANLVTEAIISAFIDQGIKSPLQLSLHVEDTPGFYPPKLARKNQLVWMENTESVKQLDGKVIPVRHIIDDHKQLVSLLTSDRIRFVADQLHNHPSSLVRIMLHPSLTELFTPDNIKQNSPKLRVALQQLASDLLRFMPSGSEDKFKDVEFLLPGMKKD